MSTKNTKFHFIPAKSPHFRGLWERAVRSVKHHLRRVVSDAALTYEEFYTLLTQIEACLNSHPLIPLSQDPNDLEVLTPGHLLIGAALTAPINGDLKTIPINRFSRFADKVENKTLEAKAQALLITTVADSHLEYLKNKASAYQMFQNLENNSKKKGVRSKLFLRR